MCCTADAPAILELSILMPMAVWWVLQVGESVIKDAFGSFVANPLQNAVQDEVPADPLPLMLLTCLNNEWRQ